MQKVHQHRAAGFVILLYNVDTHTIGQAMFRSMSISRLMKGSARRQFALHVLEMLVEIGR